MDYEDTRQFCQCGQWFLKIFDRPKKKMQFLKITMRLAIISNQGH